uniref:CUB domain-containing protein n=1 Tax=Chelonoidis abingdonii TaxID=106734 RepID=A0A8C0HCV5_CHEAB
LCSSIGDQCGGFLSNPSGSLSSPYYPGNGLITQCVWQIQIEYNRIVLFIKHLLLTSFHSLNCFQEFIEIYDGPLYAAPLLGKICKGANLSYVSSSNTLTRGGGGAVFVSGFKMLWFGDCAHELC